MLSSTSHTFAVKGLLEKQFLNVIIAIIQHTIGSNDVIYINGHE